LSHDAIAFRFVRVLCDCFKSRRRLLKDWRRIATRYDRCAHTFFSAICIAATLAFYLNQ
jgi:hypothetical protein